MNNIFLSLITKSSRVLTYSKSHHLALSAITLSLTCFEMSHSGLTEGTHIAYKNKRISLFGDCHVAGTEEAVKTQTDDLVALLKEMGAAGTGGLHVLLEKAGSTIQSTSALRNLIDLLNKNPLANVTIEDAEVRKVAISAETIFQQPFPKFSLSDSERFFDESLSYGEISFNSLNKEYNEHLAQAEQFRTEKTEELNFTSYDRCLDTTKASIVKLRQLLNKAAVNDEESLLAFSRKLWEEDYQLRKLFAAAILDVFVPLIDMHLFRRLIECPVNNILIVCGGWHAQTIRNMLVDQEAEVLIYYLDGSSTRGPQFIPLLSKSQMRGLLTGYSLSFFIKETIANGLLRVLVFIVDIRSLIEPTDPKK